MSSRTVSIISLRESNAIDGQYFMPLNTGKGIHYKRWEQIPIDDHLINKVNKIITNEKQPIINTLFLNRELD